MQLIDLNSDLGENYGRYQMFDDDAILTHITSANLACGYHAGDAITMLQAVKSAKKHGVAIGAHPALPDLQGFGRREMRVSPDEVYAFTLHQIGGLMACCMANDVKLTHVKPHGALYNMAAKDNILADAIARAIKDIDTSLILVGASGSAMIDAGKSIGLNTASEVFADRAYMQSGKLAPRTMAGAVLHDKDIITERVLEMVLHKRVKTIDGQWLDIKADTLCLHGDNPNAIALAARIKTALVEHGVIIAPLSKVVNYE